MTKLRRNFEIIVNPGVCTLPGEKGSLGVPALRAAEVSDMLRLSRDGRRLP